MTDYYFKHICYLWLSLNTSTILAPFLRPICTNYQTPQRTEQCNTFSKSPPHVWHRSDTSLFKGNIISSQQCLLIVHTSVYHTVSSPFESA